MLERLPRPGRRSRACAPRPRPGGASAGAPGAGASRLVAGQHGAARASSRRSWRRSRAPSACVLFGSGFLANTGVDRRARPAAARSCSPTRSTTPRSSTAAGSRGAETVVYPHADLDALATGPGAARAAAARRSSPTPSSRWTATWRRSRASSSSPAATARGWSSTRRTRPASSAPGGRGLVAELGPGGARSTSWSARCARRSAATAPSPAATRATASFLVNRARTLIFSTALPPPSVGAALEGAADRCARSPGVVERLQAQRARPARGAGRARASRWRPATCRSCRWSIGEPRDGDGAVRGGAGARACSPRRSGRPTVPDGTSRLRLVAMAAHQPEELRAAARLLAPAGRLTPVLQIDLRAHDHRVPAR